MSISRIQLLALAALPAFASTTARASEEAGDDTPFIETIYNFRSQRVSRTAPTAFCDGLGWPVVNVEDTFDLYSYATRGRDGRVVNTTRQKIGTVRVCLGFKSSPPVVFNFYAQFDFAGVHVTGLGLCTQQFANVPAVGSNFFMCNQSLTSPGYVGGFLVTNSANGPAAIEPGDPNLFGIHETSFATVRLWRLRNAGDDDGESREPEP